MASKSNKIKILFTIPNFDTAGSGKALLNVAMRLDKNVFEPHIMCMHNRGYFFKTVEESGIPIHILEYTTPMKPYHKGIVGCFKILRALKKINPDIIHSFHYAADYSEALSAKMAGIKWVYTKKNMNWGGSSKNGWLLRTKLAEKVAVQNTDMLKQFFKKDLDKTFLIPRGVNTGEFSPKPPKVELREQWNISSDKRILICVANLVPVKGIEILLKAFSKVEEKYPDWVLLIVGDYNNEYGEEILQLSSDLKISSKAIFTGKQPNVVDYLNSSEVFVLPTLDEGRREGSPVSLLEAMACEKYVLGSKVPGIKDQLNRFPVNLVGAGNIDGWADKLDFCFSKDKEYLKSKGIEFRNHVLSNYTIEMEVTRCEELYLGIVNN